MIRSFARTPLRTAAMQLRRGGGHAEGYNQPTGYLFGEKVPYHGASRKKINPRSRRSLETRYGSDMDTD